MTPHVASYASMAAGSQEMKVGSAVLHTVVQVPLLSLHFHVVIFFATFLVPVNTPAHQWHTSAIATITIQ